MKIIIGSVLFIIASVIQPVWCSTVSLAAHASDGGQLEQAGIGKPFLVEVIVDQAGHTIEPPRWQHTVDIHLHSSGYHLKTLNGVTQATYQFRARIDKPGTYTIGPAIIGSTSSNEITVTVGEQEKVRGRKTGHATGDGRAFLRFSLNKEKAVIGQRLKGTLRFYSIEPVNVSLLEPNPQECADITFKRNSEPTTGMQTIDDSEYHYAQWLFDIYPQKAGRCVIPAFAAEYSLPVPQASFFNPFGFINAIGSRKRIYSNGLSFNVSALPSSKIPVNVVGQFFYFESSIDRTSARVGDGLVLQLTLAGEGDLQTIKSPVLTALPAQIKWYESKQTVIPDQHHQDAEKKIFEYIIQPRDSGTFTIPAQHFTYYDVEEKRIKTISSQPITLTIVGASTTAPLAQEKEEEKSIEEVAPGATKLELAPLILSVHASQQWPVIPLPWFILLIIIMLGLLCYQCFIVVRSSFATSRLPSTKRLFADAYKQVRAAYEHKDYAMIYAAFITLFAHYTNRPLTQISPEGIQKILKEKNASEEVIMQWQYFFEQLAESVYYDAHQVSLRYPDLGSRALAWLETLKEVL